MTPEKRLEAIDLATATSLEFLSRARAASTPEVNKALCEAAGLAAHVAGELTAVHNMLHQTEQMGGQS